MTKFNWVTTWLLSIVTFGIYSLYVWYVMGDNSNKMAKDNGQKEVFSFIIAVVASIFTFGIVGLVWTFLYCQQQCEIAKARGVELTSPANLS